MLWFIRSFCIKARAFFAAFLSAALACAVAIPLFFPLCGAGVRGNIGTSGTSGANGAGNETAGAMIRKEIGGVYTLYSSSSSGAFTKSLRLSEILCVRGEAAVYELTNADGDEAREAALNEILNEFRARVLFTERTENAVSYYCYSSKIGSARAKKIGGNMVNLHAVFRGDEAVIGVPLVFSGY